MSIANSNKRTYTDGMDHAGLIESAEKGSVKGIQIALEAGVNVNIQEPDTGITAAHAAIAGGHWFALEELLNTPEIDLHLKDNFGRSAIGLALSHPREDIILMIEEFLDEKLSRTTSDTDPQNVVELPRKDP